MKWDNQQRTKCTGKAWNLNGCERVSSSRVSARKKRRCEETIQSAGNFSMKRNEMLTIRRKGMQMVYLPNVSEYVTRPLISSGTPSHIQG